MRSGGGAADEVIELSSDDDKEPVPSASARRIPLFSPRDVNPYALADVKPLLFPLHPPYCRALVPVKDEEPVPVPVPAASSPPPRALPPPRLCRQFWKSGDYVVARRNPDVDAPGGRNRLRINPKFLHSNATSHKWAFGNDGGGMDPEALRRCLSFGFSDKQSDAFIGQYENGFKTSTMRLGADVIVFTQNQKNGSLRSMDFVTAAYGTHITFYRPVQHPLILLKKGTQVRRPPNRSEKSEAITSIQITRRARDLLDANPCVTG